MVAPLTRVAGRDERILVGPETGDDAGVFDFDGRALISTADFITPVCDDPERFGAVAAANSLSDVYAMGGEPLFALNLCCFPGSGVPEGVLSAILEGAARTLARSGGVLLGGHTVEDQELKFGLAVVGIASPERLLTNARAEPGQRLVLTKPLGTGVLINAFKFDKLDARGLEPALVEMERLNAEAAGRAAAHGARAATDVTGFGLVGHGLNLARGSGVGLRLRFDHLPVHEAFYELVDRGVSTGCTEANRSSSGDAYRESRSLTEAQREVLFDPQTSGGLLIAVPTEGAAPLVEELVESGHRAAEVGEVVEGPPAVEIV